MVHDKSHPQTMVSRREGILDSAERLLAQGSAAFSMRELADEAGVSFATPFNQFGSKAAIMLALSARRIASMHAQLAAAERSPTAVARVLLAVEIAATTMLSAPDVNRIVMGAISAPGDAASDVANRSSALWAEALGAGDGLAPATRRLALGVLPHQLAIAFRGVLSFWTAGELKDTMLVSRAHAAAATVLLGFVGRDGRAALLAFLEQ